MRRIAILDFKFELLLTPILRLVLFVEFKVVKVFAFVDRVKTVSSVGQTPLESVDDGADNEERLGA